MSLLVAMLVLASTARPVDLPLPPPPAGMAPRSVVRRVDLPLPPPPPGMVELTAVQRTELLGDAAPEPEAEAQSAELEELRALEDAELAPTSLPGAEALQEVYHLGFGNPLRHRLGCAFEDDELVSDAATAPISPITDLANFDVSTLRDNYDIPVEMQPLVAQYINFFQNRGRKWFRNWMSRSTRFIPLMTPILEARGLPRDTVYLAMIESGFSAHAYSWASAAGPWQFIASTGKHYGLKQDFWVDERRDPVKATHAAARYLNQLHGSLGHWYLAWAGYNTGGGRVQRLINRLGTKDFWKLSEGRGLAKETKHYVPKLIAAALIAKHPAAFGFTDSEFSYQQPFTFEEVRLQTAADLEVLARAAGVTVEELRDLNPELKRWCTPPASAEAPYVLRVPVGTATPFAEAFERIGPRERLAFQAHTVKKGDTLSAIAARYGSASEAIMRMNGLRSVRALRLGTALVVPVPSRAGGADPALARQVNLARRGGFSAPRPEEEVPAGTPTRTAQGSVKTEVVGGKTRLTYGVQGGDTLWAISHRFGCTVEELRRWNNLSKRGRLQVGMPLFVWGRTKVAAD